MSKQDVKEEHIPYAKKEELPFTEMVTQEVRFVVRGLQILNGGGIIALLAFLGQNWGSSNELINAMLNAIIMMVLGLVFITWSSILKLRSLDRWQKSKKLYGWRRLVYHYHVYINLRNASFIMFIAACLYLVISIKMLVP